MPTLLQVNSIVNIASTGRLVEDLGEVAINNEWSSYIAYGREIRPSKSILIRIGGRWDVYAHLLKGRFLDRQGFGSKNATRKLISEIEKIKPDIIQFHNIHGYYLNIPEILQYIAKKDIPLVWSLHDCWSMTGHCAHFALVGCEKWKSQCYDCPLIHSYPQSLLLDNSRKNYSQKKELISAVPRLTIISGSQWLADIACQSYHKKRKIYIIPDGIDTNIYSPRNNGKELRERYKLGNKFVIMASGTSWSPFKGLDDFKKLRSVLSDDYAIIFVGMSKSDIASLPAGMLGIQRTRTPEELAEYYSMADCVMSLSKLESFGLTPVEGFACGTPAIVNNCTALPELITPETGFVVKAGDIDDIKSKVIQLKKIGKQYYSGRCREIALEKYSRDVCYKQYLNLYSTILSY